MHDSDHKYDPKGTWWIARPENTDFVFWILVGSCVFLVVFDLFYHNFFHAKHGYFIFETAIGFHAIYGFVAFLFVVTVGVQLRKFLQRPEDYYDVPYIPIEDDHHDDHDDHSHDHDSDGGHHG